MYSFQSRVRYSELSWDERLSIPAIVDYFQDCSTFQSGELGRGIAWLNEHHRCWVVNSWQVKILKRPGLAELITIGTWPHAMRGMFGERNFCLRDRDGQDLVQAESLWTYMNTETMKPVKVDADVLSAYQLEDALPVAWKGRKISIPEKLVRKEDIVVGCQLLDTNGHVNNGKYVLLAMEYVPRDFSVVAFRVEYKRSVLLGERMIPYVAQDENCILVVFKNEENQVDTVVEFERG